MEARVHGELHCMDCIDRDEGMALASTIILSMCDVTEKQFYPHLHQDGRIAERFLKPLGIFGARYAHMPAVGGLYVVMRLIKEEARPSRILNHWVFARSSPGTQTPVAPSRRHDHFIRSHWLREIHHAPHRLRRLACAMGYINKLPIRRLLTIEDPPEGRIDVPSRRLLSPTRKTPKKSNGHGCYRCRMPCAVIGCHFKRRNPRSGIRSYRLKAAMTGHLVMTTLHANDGLNILERLEIEGVSARLLADPQLLIGLISQRLVQRLCRTAKSLISR